MNTQNNNNVAQPQNNYANNYQNNYQQNNNNYQANNYQTNSYNEPNAEFVKNDGVTSGRLEVPDDIPPYLRKLKEHR